ncbi:hypothetical protein ACOT81_23210 [Streptomyces sp. WI04-05B]|uniref:hypothetical protein n=1 Tax=Streptomyces TaxID=1883 RepID=UPI0029BB351D|nr:MULTISPECIES: hypothetical protein [unclassified Streptomyces]MDX2548381.1 hypothetical protein [Streptomyces sp. WI04-05B]MDX2590317.1 hypothetical protein [Streptomyces sp. WI04-05A]
MAGPTGSPGSTTGTALLLAASPVGKGCLVDAASVLPVLAAVAPAVLAGTDTANVVELADPLEPQAVLTRLRAAAVTPGPLTVFLTGQLQLDRKQHLPHLALARTTPATVRYTAFPWHWIAEELRLRAPGTTTLFLDLHADAAAWQYVTGRVFAAGRGVSVYGRIAPPPPRRAVAVPTYMKAVATILRSGYRPEAGQLHQQAIGRLSSDGVAYGDVVLFSPPPPLPVPSVPGGSAPRPPVRAERARPQTPPEGGPPDGLEMRAGAEESPTGAGNASDSDPHSFITSAVQAGRHGDADAVAARWEQAALREHGPASEEALHWTEVRADLAMFAGDPARSCRVWLAVAGARLGVGQASDAPAVEAAVDRAHHQWTSLGESADARELGPVVVELRRRVPGRREGAVRHAERRLERLGERSGQRVPG